MLGVDNPQLFDKLVQELDSRAKRAWLPRLQWIAQCEKNVKKKETDKFNV